MSNGASATLASNPDELVERLPAHHAREAEAPPARPAPGYRPEVLQALFGDLPVSGEATQRPVTDLPA